MIYVNSSTTVKLTKIKTWAKNRVTTMTIESVKCSSEFSDYKSFRENLVVEFTIHLPVSEIAVILFRTLKFQKTLGSKAFQSALVMTGKLL